MTESYIAIDIGASSGRLMLSQKNDIGKITLKEVHRFKNGFSKNDGIDCWDTGHLIKEILNGLEKIKKGGIDTCYTGIDTWGVDYCLIDNTNQLISQPVSYRDNRTQNVLQEFDENYPLKRLYQKTGIQLQPFNTVFQLFKEDQAKLKRANQLLLIPDYLGFVLTGEKVLEKTNASTMQLLNLNDRKLDTELLTLLHVEDNLFPRLTEPGAMLGKLKRDSFPDYELPDTTFISVASHDTASAVVGTPGKGDDWAYLSSGTWSLVGVETEEGIATKEAYEANFTNEWGVQGTIRFLKNIMGMWLIQEVARMENYRYSYPELADLAQKVPAYKSLIDVNDPRFLHPVDMTEEIQVYCRETNQTIPRTTGEIARCIYDSLALCYAIERKKLEKITGKTIKILHIVGGGSNNDFLNQLTADTCEIPISAGPDEATAIGNIVVQMVATQGFGTLAEARTGVEKSFPLKNFTPHTTQQTKQALVQYTELIDKSKKLAKI